MFPSFFHTWYNWIMHETNISTKMKLVEAARKCMQKTSVEDLTVKQICDAVPVSRQSFYRCFKDKYDLINWYFDRILKESFHQMGSGRTIRESLVRKFTYIQEEYTFFRAAFSTDTQNNLRDHDFDMIFAFYQDLIERKSGKPLQDRLKDVLEMYCSASVYMTVKWVMHDLPVSPEALAETMISGMPQELEKTFQEYGLM